MRMPRHLIQLDTQLAEINRRMVEVLVFFTLAGASWLFIANGEVAIVQGWQNSHWMAALQPIFRALTDPLLYPFYALFLVGLTWGVMGKQVRVRGLALRYLGAQLLGSVLVVRVTKMWLGRGRPESVLPGEYTGDWWLWTLDASFHSMPSGHTADLFTGAVMLALLAPKRWLRMSLLGFACIGGLSRVVVAAHWPSDVLVGAIIGASSSYLVLRLWPLRD